MELERNGRNLQHFCRELARYFRNLLVVKVAGTNTRLIAATAQEQERLAGIAESFSEEDLTRYLQITLDVFKDLQFSLQPRLHLEIGLLKLVQAGRLTAIEEVLGGMGVANQGVEESRSRGVGSQGIANRGVEESRSRGVGSQGAGSQGVRESGSQGVARPGVREAGRQGVGEKTGDLRQRLHSAAVELGMPFTADALEHSQVIEKNTELQFITTSEFKLSMDPKELQKAVQQVLGRQMKITVTVGEPEIPAGAVAPRAAADENDATERALAHPEVKRFREMFPDAQVRTVRNLKE